ncbi:squalene synthase HpnC [Undibacterium sp. RuRC25W]|uniref:squalene synthase HpnC n=1 Tax=Undibacterium sp. RuRC25W TaxID=3413047 RepID=UPI003BF0F16A
MSVEHYENFPVASLLLPRHLRQAVKNIYIFARTADDFADEGTATPVERLTALEDYDDELRRIEQGEPTASPIFQALATTIEQHNLPLSPFRDLLSAFKQDITTARYKTYFELVDYCRRSANPVGCLMLHLYDKATTINLQKSDAICTALQLINFWQDIAIDLKKDRIYLPLEDLRKFDVQENLLESVTGSDNWIMLMHFQSQRARALMLSGASLHKELPWRFDWELRLVIQGGLRIIEKIDKVQGDVFKQRPTLKKWDWMILMWRAMWM